MIVARFSREIPEVCWADNAINDFQKAQCHEFWSRLRFGWLVGLIPWFSLALFLWGAQRSIARVYAQADEKIRRGRADHQAVVTAPPQAPLDWFAWFYGLRPIAVAFATESQGARGVAQRKIYLPLDREPPHAGERFAVFAPLRILRTERHIGVRYTPHVATKSG